jgi:hypothetical protein
MKKIKCQDNAILSKLIYSTLNIRSKKSIIYSYFYYKYRAKKKCPVKNTFQLKCSLIISF